MESWAKQRKDKIMIQTIKKPTDVLAADVTINCAQLTCAAFHRTITVLKPRVIIKWSAILRKTRERNSTTTTRGCARDAKQKTVQRRGYWSVGFIYIVWERTFPPAFCWGSKGHKWFNRSFAVHTEMGLGVSFH